MDANKQVVTSMSPNEKEEYSVVFDAADVTGEVTVAYKIYYRPKVETACSQRVMMVLSMLIRIKKRNY
ncbi:MAG TPA: hypothetical protein DD827_11465 [Gammaproteobacteria bacterium]|jgi:hypothetical protein|nr:hypothetical protein [Gammaproteobacteria bacterium]